MNFLRLYSRVAWLLFFALTILFLDFFTKAYVFHVLTFQHEAPLQFFEIPVFHNLLGIDFTISLATNTGMAWGLFANFQTLLLVIRLVAIFLMCVYLFFFNTNRALEFPLVLIITGALGNVIDFFLYGFVVDFLHFNLWGYHFPVFNFADTAITIGVFWLFFASLVKKKSIQNNA